MKTGTAIKLIVLGLLLAGAGVGLRALAHYTSEEQLMAMLRREADDLGLEVAADSLAFGLPYGLRARGFSLALKGSAEPLLTAREVIVGIDWGEALRGRPVPSRLVLREPTMDLAYDPVSHAWNVEALDLFAAPTGRFFREGILLQDATLFLRNPKLFKDDDRRTYTGLHLTVTKGAPGSGRWSFEGRAEDEPLDGLRLSGWANTADGAAFSAWIEGGDFQADSAFWHLTPFAESLQPDWRAEGRVAVRGRVASTGEGPLDYTFRMDLLNGRVRTKYFPAWITGASGSLKVTPSAVIARDLGGVVLPAEVGQEGTTACQVRVSGIYRFNHRGGSFDIEALDVPLCRHVIEGIPQAGPEIWRRLQPEGRGSLSLTLNFPPGKDEDGTKFAAIIGLQGATARPLELPLPVEQLSGALVVDNTGVRFRHLHGIIRQPDEADPAGSQAHVAIDGWYDFDELDTALDVAVRNLKTNQEILAAIPEAGEQIWEEVRPLVTVDASIRLRSDPDEDEGLDHNTAIQVYGGTAMLAFYPVPLQEVRGSLKVDGTDVFIERLAAEVGPGGAAEAPLARSAVAVSGKINAETQASEIYVIADGLVLTEELLTALPEFGEIIWDAARPTGRVSLSGKYTSDGGEEPDVAFFLDLAARDVSLMLKTTPVPATSISGQALVTQDRIVSNYFTGLLCGGRITGAAVVNYGPDREHSSYAASVEFRQVDLTELIWHLEGEETEMAGLLEGTLDIGGFLEEDYGRRGGGVVELTEAYLWDTPLFVGLIHVLRLSLPTGRSALGRGEMTFSLIDDVVHLHEFEVVGGGLNASGYGTVTMDHVLDLTVVAVGAPKKGGGIPVISRILSFFLAEVEKQLVRLKVTGTLEEPDFDSTVLQKITWPLTTLRGILFAPF